MTIGPLSPATDHVQSYNTKNFSNFHMIEEVLYFFTEINL